MCLLDFLKAGMEGVSEMGGGSVLKNMLLIPNNNILDDQGAEG